MSVRIKSRWHDQNQERSLAEIAGAVGFNAWKAAANALLELENEGFMTYSNDHRLLVMSEFLAFLLQVGDRLAHQFQLDDDERKEFVTGLARHFITTFSDNKQELLGPGDYATPFIDLLNQRGEEYAETSFADGEAKIDFLRVLGNHVAEVIGDSDNQHWIAQHVMELEGPDCVKIVRKAMESLLK